MCTLSFRSGIPLAKKNSTDCARYHMVTTPSRQDDLHLRSRRRKPTPSTNIPPDDTDLIMLCYSVDSKDSLENVESKWVGEITDNCPGVKLVLVALKCDLREGGGDDEADDAAASAAAPADGNANSERPRGPLIEYDKGLEVAKRIGASRYLECSAMKNRGVNEAFTEAARVALSVKKEREENKCTVM
ncbi:Small GTPase superfamily, Rho type [Metarhizium robertsii ARSEF 23]|uniref:Small GTPase superfamily, Rho type n=1 Tax=Metarhizium robertsii (strain ARSEF 23 / ATCC MYA-3075) TaxID=655844 RepID=E9ELF1_METRA|nr:Small GTPase superfamily, Rho type [Metarhizium robertsii ARSEF 23]EFZ03929.1 Small GTPase superfamily, Rho type [Metarhizium robertsii ARSEF 23]